MWNKITEKIPGKKLVIVRDTITKEYIIATYNEDSWLTQEYDDFAIKDTDEWTNIPE